MKQPKFSEVLRTYAAGLTAPWDNRWKNLNPGETITYIESSEQKIAEMQAKSTRKGLEELAKLYEMYETETV